jgi:hypothetical protein
VPSRPPRSCRAVLLGPFRAVQSGPSRRLGGDRDRCLQKLLLVLFPSCQGYVKLTAFFFLLILQRVEGWWHWTWTLLL